MGTVIAFPAERCSIGSGMVGAREDSSVIILPVIRMERHDDTPSDGYKPGASGTRGKRRKR